MSSKTYSRSLLVEAFRTSYRYPNLQKTIPIKTIFLKNLDTTEFFGTIVDLGICNADYYDASDLSMIEFFNELTESETQIDGTRIFKLIIEALVTNNQKHMANLLIYAIENNHQVQEQLSQCVPTTFRSLFTFDNIEQLIIHLKPTNGLLSHLEDKRVLTHCQREYLASISNHRTKLQILIRMLKKRPNSDVDKFLECLTFVGQTELCEKIILSHHHH